MRRCLVIPLDSHENLLHRTIMQDHPWDADASVFKYPPLGASGSDDPFVVFDGTLRACFRMVADLTDSDRRDVEIETLDGEALYNSVDIARMIRSGDYR